MNDYQAATNVNDKIRAKFESILDKGRNSAVETMTRLESERPNDRIVNTKAFKFKPNNTGLIVDVDGDEFHVHKHALNQAVGKTGVLGQTTVRKLMETGKPWARELAADMLNKTYENVERDRLLIRSVGNQVRGVLSDKYRRMDSGPIFESFIQATQEFGCLPTDGRSLDTKSTLTMSLPHVFEPIPNEPLGMVLFGATLSNSDYGDGALSLKFAMLRIWCTNMCMRDEVIRKIHLGKRLADNVKFSEKTYMLDTETQASAVKDLIAGFLAPARVNEEMDRVRKAAEEAVDVKDVFQILYRKNSITKAEKNELIDVYNTPDVEMLPPGNNLWRASNAVSLFAQKEGVTDYRAVELQNLAGDMLDAVAV